VIGLVSKVKLALLPFGEELCAFLGVFLSKERFIFLSDFSGIFSVRLEVTVEDAHIQIIHYPRMLIAGLVRLCLKDHKSHLSNEIFGLVVIGNNIIYEIYC
jgi:hypothetical protein